VRSNNKKQKLWTETREDAHRKHSPMAHSTGAVAQSLLFAVLQLAEV